MVRPAGHGVGLVNGHRGPVRVTGDGGFVTAETAVALPALVLVLGVAIWGVSAVAARLSCLDAARLGARAAARGDALPVVRAITVDAAARSAVVTVHRDRELTRVTVTTRVRPPAGFGVAAVRVRATATARTEPGVAVDRR